MSKFYSSAFATASGVYLRFDDPGAVSETLGPLPGSGAVVADVTIRNRYAKLSENRFCLVLMDIHERPPVVTNGLMEITHVFLCCTMVIFEDEMTYSLLPNRVLER